VFDGGRVVGRIYRLDDGPDNSVVPGRVVQLTGGRSYRHAPTLDDVKAAFKSEYERSQRHEFAECCQQPLSIVVHVILATGCRRRFAARRRSRCSG
jgi:hypothetical protein